MRKIYITILGIASTMALCAFTATAQAPTDAYRNVKNGTFGTARFQALGGAMGAVGADASAATVNPAGAALFQRNTSSFGFDLGKWDTHTKGLGGETDANKFLGNFNHSSYFFGGSLIDLSGGNYMKINGGLSYDKEYNHSRSYGLLSGALPGGITDLMAYRAIKAGVKASEYMRDKEYDPFMYPLDPMVAMGMNGEMITHIPYNDWNSVDFASNFHTLENGEMNFLLPVASNLNVSESGGRNSTDITVAGSVNDRYYFGASLKIGTSSYSRYSMYREDFDNKSYLEYGNMLNTTGTSFGVNLGAMFAVGDYGRLGISYLTPQYAQYDELYRATSRVFNIDFPVDSRQVDFDTDEYRSSYGMWTPSRLTLSGMVFLGRYGFVSYDYQYRNLGSMKLLYPKSMDKMPESNYIKEDYGNEHTHRVGIELRPISWLSVRGGYSYTGNPMKVEALRQDPLSKDITYEVPSSGLIADYVLPQSFSTYSAGLGFNIGWGISLDLAYVHSKREQSVYPFSAYSFNDQNGTKYALSVRGGQLTESRNSLVTTMVFRF